MFMKHYAPNRCEPNIESLNFGGSGFGGVRADIEKGSFWEIQKKKNFFLEGCGRVGGWGSG